MCRRYHDISCVGQFVACRNDTRHGTHLSESCPTLRLPTAHIAGIYLWMDLGNCLQASPPSLPASRIISRRDAKQSGFPRTLARRLGIMIPQGRVNGSPRACVCKVDVDIELGGVNEDISRVQGFSELLIISSKQSVDLFDTQANAERQV